MLFGNAEPVFNDAALRKALEFLRERGPTLADGRHEMTDGMFAMVSTGVPGDPAGKLFETHVKYADLQYGLEGGERILVVPAEGMAVVDDRLEESDIRFHAEPGGGLVHDFTLTPGAFLLLLPEDAHKPGCYAGFAECRKAVVKMPVGMLERSDPH